MATLDLVTQIMIAELLSAVSKLSRQEFRQFEAGFEEVRRLHDSESTEARKWDESRASEGMETWKGEVSTEPDDSMPQTAEISAPPRFSSRAAGTSKKVTAPHEDVTYRIIGACITVHKRIGPGQKEAIYQRALEAHFTEIGVNFEAQKQLPVYDGNHLLGFYIPDFIVEDKVILEIKAFANVHQKYLGQVITYLNHTELAIGLLINFGERLIRPRRVFPSPQRTEYLQQPDYSWIFIPDWLKAQNRIE